MQNSPLELEEYLLKDLQFSLIDDLSDVPGKVKYDPLNIEINPEVRMRGEEPRKWRCELAVRSKVEEGRNHPYRFVIRYVGFFRVVEDFPAERVETMVRANAPALLYSAAREALLYITGRGRYPAILLPSVTFIEPAKASASKAKTASKKPRKSAKKGQKK